MIKINSQKQSGDRGLIERFLREREKQIKEATGQDVYYMVGYKPELEEDDCLFPWANSDNWP